MTIDKDRIWKAKLTAWTHDPAEKSLILLRDPAGHEKGTVSKLRREIFADDRLPDDLLEIVRTADQWASAADRPQFPRNPEDGRYAQWTQVRFDERPVLIHPLSGEHYDLGSLREVDIHQIKAVSFDHFDKLVVRNGTDKTDLRKTFLAFWRCGPESPAAAIGELWRMLPADTRVPDHSIWEHLNLVSAFAGAMAADPEGRLALLKMTIGPVQGFIAQARSTSDLWAGSHLLSRVIWAGLEKLCDKYGPDSVLFPDLHGIPLVDAWLENQKIGFHYPYKKTTDENPLFSAALPNLFVAIVPESSAVDLAQELSHVMRDWAYARAQDAARELLRVTGHAEQLPDPMVNQIRDQLSEFPEIYWSIVPWKLAPREGNPDTTELVRVMKNFYPPGTTEPGFLGSPAWRALRGEIKIEGAEFYRPNPGVLYPALYDLVDRATAAAKTARHFTQLRQEGYRCSLCGEREWLTADREQLEQSRGKRKGTLWQSIASIKPAWAKKGEHLCALCTLKRLWPTLFIKEADAFLDEKIDRFVVSTHAMAMAPTLLEILDKARESPAKSRKFVESLLGEIDGLGRDRAALPARIIRRFSGTRDDLFRCVTGLPLLLDRVADTEDDVDMREANKQRSAKIRSAVENLVDHGPERYYALILMDGDSMGAWVSGTDPEMLPSYEVLWHPDITTNIKGGRFASTIELGEYMKTSRPPSPARHVAISRALNGFAFHLAPAIVEEMYTGKLIYAGGDDVLAMVSVRDLLDLMLTLRCAYSGLAFSRDNAESGDPRLGRGHALFRGHLLRLMGQKATASMGAVVAHYSAPMGAVLRELRCAERGAKNLDGKDAFSVTLMKRAGGTTNLTAKWLLPKEPGIKVAGSTVQVLGNLRQAFASKLARQAAYQIQEWLSQLSEESTDDQLNAIMTRQFRRHKKKDKEIDAMQLASSLVAIARNASPMGHLAFLRDSINLTEFLAREGRA